MKFPLLASCYARLRSGRARRGCIVQPRRDSESLRPQNPQPGDVLTVTIYPAAGETIEGVGMAAFDTDNVKFYGRDGGIVRAFVGFPFDRNAGNVSASGARCG